MPFMVGQNNHISAAQRRSALLAFQPLTVVNFRLLIVLGIDATCIPWGATTQTSGLKVRDYKTAL
jgi:hypothetical protein